MGVRSRYFWLLFCLLAFAFAPLFLSTHYIFIITELLIFGLFAMSLDIMMGYTGMISFGHAAYFGVGAYASAIMLVQFSFPLPLAVLAGAIASTAIAVPIGFLCTRASGVYFAMLTLAFAQMIYAIVFKWYTVTGGSDGIAGIPRSNLGFESISLESGDAFYYFTLILVLLCVYVCGKLVKSPFGKTLTAIKENEKKVENLGVNVRKLKLISFVVAAFFGGISGALFAPFTGFASPELLFWTYSGMCLLMLVIGGVGTMLGSFAGAAVFILSEEIISDYTDNYLLIVGVLFIFVVLFLPGGVFGTFKNRLKKEDKAVTN